MDRAVRPSTGPEQWVVLNFGILSDMIEEAFAL